MTHKTFPLAGLKHRPKADQDVFDKLPDLGNLHIVPEPTNEFDKGALKIMCDGDCHVGYIPQTQHEVRKRYAEGGVKRVVKKYGGMVSAIFDEEGEAK